MFDALDGYLVALHAGDFVACQRWLHEHPQWREMAECFDAVESLALGAANAPRDAAGALRRQFAPQAPLARPAGGRTEEFGETLIVHEFGRYELIEEIGRGGMGVVYKARQLDLDRIVALKMILSHRLAAPDDVKRFHREARAAGSLRHPNIVGIHEAGQVHGQHFFAMDFVEGESLSALVAKGRWDAHRAAHCMALVARAVQYLHEHGIIHRDLKPSNILIDRSGNPAVTDFGLVKIYEDPEDRTQTGVILGTPGYMPPEQAAGRVSEISHRSDVYSLGAILYELLTGRPPFRDDNPLNTLLQVLESEPTPLGKIVPEIEEELARICMRCLEKDPARRFPSAEALAQDLERFLRSEPIETQPQGFSQRIRRWVRRDTTRAARLAILLAALVIMQAQHTLSGQHWAYHLEIKVLFGFWIALSCWFQTLLRGESMAESARLVWAVVDPLVLTVVLFLVDEEIGPLLIGYPLLVTASGLWFRVRLVAVSTCACLLASGFLFWLRYASHVRPPRLIAFLLNMQAPQASDTQLPAHFPVIFAASLVVIGCVVAFQVHRVRTLSHYFERSRP
jgi:eukaryotic-like serine/threonine-protein kinase